MISANSKVVLSKLIELTSERDVNSLEIVLAQTLFDLVASGSVVVYHLVDMEKRLFSSTRIGEMAADDQIPDNLQQELIACFDSAQSRVFQQAPHSHLKLYPLMGFKTGPVAVIAVLSDDAKPDMDDVTSMLLQIYQNFISLINDNERDTLTGLLNRKTFELKINKVLSQMLSYMQRATDIKPKRYFLAIFDIDHFKHVNDGFGHLIGDEVLLLFSRLMTKTFRDRDMLFRFGGEEFVAVFECQDEMQMQLVLDRFRESVSEFEFPQVGNITVSGGYTEVSVFDTSSQMLDRADVALYFAKNNGRNRICSYEMLIESGRLLENKIEGAVELF